VQEAALYDPEFGFYGAGRGAAGRSRDFLTSPEVGPLFGAVLARVLDAWWDALDRPNAFRVVEAAAGVGTLATSIRAARPRCGDALRYHAVERSSALRSELPDWVEAHVDLSEVEVADVVLANELLDNLPVRLCVRRANRWREVMVDLDRGADDPEGGAALRFVAGDEVLDERLPFDADDGAHVPLADAARDWVRKARALAPDGWVCVVDYGVEHGAALARRPLESWLRTYRGHERGLGPLASPGQQDVTCEVPFDQLAFSAGTGPGPGDPAGRRERPPDRFRQADFLRAHGLDALVEEGRRIWRERAGIADLAALTARSRVREAEALVDPDGLGAFQVVLWSPSAAQQAL